MPRRSISAPPSPAFSRAPPPPEAISSRCRRGSGAAGPGRGLRRADLEHVAAPRGQVEIETSRQQLVSVTLVAGRTHEVPESHGTASQLWKRQVHVALTLVSGVVDGDEPALAAVPFPRPGDEAVPRPVSLPRRDAFVEPPSPVANDGLGEHAP